MTALPRFGGGSPHRRARLRLIVGRRGVPSPTRTESPAPRLRVISAGDVNVLSAARRRELLHEALADGPRDQAAADHLVDVLAGPIPIRLPSGDLSASGTVSTAQRRTAIAVGLPFLALLALAPIAAMTLVVALCTVLYLAALGYRMVLFWSSLKAPAVIRVSDDEAVAIPDDELPVYTVLVPAYREPEVIGTLLAQIDAIDYPRAKLDVKLLLEEDDAQTYEAALAASPGPHVEVIRVPDSTPKTKPKACNVGLARARGAFVTVYDAEDRPEPLQLRRAVLAFRRVAPDVACLQAKLSYYNGDQNLLTRWFTAEYDMWFGQLLPGLIARKAPLPLGGTSNHFRRDMLIGLGGWDAWNVTEDADLGIRLHRIGLRTEVLESVTLEEANSDFVNWVKQRSRWYKGYLQTWLVHMRHPVALVGALGVRGFIGFNLFVGGTPFLSLMNPVFWGMTVAWFLAQPAFIAALFPTWLYYLALFAMVCGNAAVYYSSLVGARLTGRPSLVIASLAVPVYWVMMSIAAVKAFVQLLSSPSFWEKTIHGLDRRVGSIQAAQPELEGPAT
jgi:cellulose synthase/poly-beta-1,6-N-acetylglucosamine synthase-like glycosyltransferase